MIRRLPTMLMFIAGILAAPAVFAQSNGAIRGVVKDASGAVIPGATVTLTAARTQQKVETVTTEAGAYVFAFLAPGDYSLAVDLAGFRRFVRDRIPVDVAASVTMDVTLVLGGVEESITVSGEAPQLQLTTSSLGQVVDNKTLTGVPLSSRNFTQILALSAGVTSDIADAGAFGRNSVNISANGQRPWDNGVVMNGLSADNPMSQGFDDTQDKTGVPVPAPDAIEQFKVQTGLYDAVYGKQSGAVVNIVTKSGGSTFHGSGYEFLRNDAFNANDFFRNRSGAPKPVLRQNQFGGSTGGPMVKNKAFFFVSYQGTRQKNGVAAAASRNTFLPLLGDRSAQALGSLYAGKTGSLGGVEIAGDGSNINPVALQILNAKLPNGEFVIPAPQIVLANGTGFSALSSPADFKENQIIANVDVNVSPKQRLMLKTFVSSFPSTLPFSLSSNVFGFGETDQHSNTNLALTHTMTINSTTVNELRAGFSRSNMVQSPVEPLSAASVGMSPAVADKPGLTQISISGMFTIGPDPNNDQQVLINTAEVSDTLSKIMGRHELRMGGNISPTRVTRHEVYVKRGTLSFLSFPDFLLGMSGAENGTPFSNISSSLVGNGREYAHPGFNNFAAFFQDDFRATDRLTFNLGIRYQYNGQQYLTDGVEANFDPSRALGLTPPAGGTLQGFMLPANVPSDVPIPDGVTKLDTNTLVNNNNWHGYSPRVGLAWTPSARRTNLVVHAGYGLFWSAVAGTIAEQMFVNPPFYALVSGGGANTPTATLQNPYPNVPQLSQFPIWSPYAIGSALSLYGLDPNILQPRSQEYSGNVQSEIHGIFFQIGYVGSQTTNLVASSRPNQALLASPDNPVNGQTTNTVANRNLRVPVLGFSPTALQFYGDMGGPYFGHYNSFQLSARKIYSKGISFSAAYTWSRSIDNIRASASGRNQPIGGTTGDFYNHPVGISDFDRTHRFVASYVWDLPKVKSAAGAIGQVVNGWSISGVGTLQSGLPFSVTDNRGGTIYGASSYAQFAPGKGPADAALADPTLNQYFNTSAYTAPPRVGDGTGFGDSGRNYLRGPGQINFDTAVVKLFPLGANQLEFRAEIFNLFNRPNFGLPGTNVGSPSSFGVISSTVVAPRILQFALRYRF